MKNNSVMRRILGSRTFQIEDQLAFAALSGDYNPLHVDEIAARRLMFGQPVVHGVHSMLWALDQWVAQRGGAIELHALRVEFRHPICIGEEVQCELQSEAGSRSLMVLLRKGVILAKITLEWRIAGEHNINSMYSSVSPARRASREWRTEELRAASGELMLHMDPIAAGSLFPSAVRLLPKFQVAALLATTRLVGVECPGLHSIYSDLNLSFDSLKPQGGLSEAASLKYAVINFDDRFNLLVMSVVGPMFSGKIKAFVRPTPKEQVRYVDVQRCIAPDEFVGQRALVVGGSRGLGEVMAKLLAAGGADVKLTYCRGAVDATRVVEEIRCHAGLAGAFRLDVTQEGSVQMEGREGWMPTHLYYFATSFIASGGRGQFCPERFAEFCRYYVNGFANLVQNFAGKGLQKVFYPSSAYVDESPDNVGEYAAAKMAGESVCRFIEKNTGIPMYCPRLPRMATDQTVCLTGINTPEPLPILLQHVRLFESIEPKQ